jgi:hypothetical protein
VGEPDTITADPGQAARLVPTWFAGLQPAPAPLPAVSPGPFGRHLAGAGTEEIVAQMRRVWPGGRDSERARARGARLLLEHLTAFPGGSWQQRWESGRLDGASRAVNMMIPGPGGRLPVPGGCCR